MRYILLIFFFLKKQTKCMAAEWQRCIFSYCGGKCAAFGRGWERLVPALGQSSIVDGGETCSCPLLPWLCTELEPVDFGCFYLLLNHFDLWREKRNRTFDSVVKALI